MPKAVQLFAAMMRLAVIAAARGPAYAAVRGEWRGTAPSPIQRVYFANHTSHGDFVLIWTVMPAPIRARLRPVAAADYWLRGPVRRFVIGSVFRGVLIICCCDDRPDPIEAMTQALDAGDSLIIFPEGTTAAGLLPFKRGIHRLAGGEAACRTRAGLGRHP